MRIAPAIVFIFACLCISCGKQPVNPALALAGPKPPKINFLPAPFLNEVVSTAHVSNSVISWEAILVQFKVDDAERLGLQEIFAYPGEKNAVIEKQNALSPLVQTARADTNIVLQIASGSYAVRTTFADSTNLLLHLEKTFGTDILSHPTVTTTSTNEALLQLYEARTIVLCAEGSDTSALRTTNISTGHSVSMQLLGNNDRGLMIEVAARLEVFHGYHSEKRDAPLPKFVVSTMGTRTQLSTNEVLILGGPIQMSVVRTTDRIEYLSDIPAIGQLFTKTHAHTNFLRTLVIVRPTLKNYFAAPGH